MAKQKETPIPKLKYKDWYINLPAKSIPDYEDEEEAEVFWEKQKELCTRGCYVEDTYFPGLLYWHLNFWHTEVTQLNQDGDTIEVYTQPTLRDNEWIIANALQEAKKQRKGLVILGARRLGKSVFLASYIAHGATLDPHSQNVFVGVNGDDIKITTSKISKGLDTLPLGLQWMRIQEDWKKQVTLGVKMSGGKKIPFSEIVIRNLDNGNNEEAIAGTKPRTLTIEEIGKNSFKKGLQAAIPGFTTPYGWGCSPLLIGCVCAGTKVFTNSGKVVNIEDLKQEDGIVGYDGTSFAPQTISHMNPPTKKACYRITTTSGKTISCSSDHPFLSSSRSTRVYNKLQYSFKKAEDLVPGEYLATIREVPLFGDTYVKDARLFGLFLGDGYFKGRTLSVEDADVRDFVTSNYDTSIYKNFITKGGLLFTDIFLKGMNNVFKDEGFNELVSVNKKFPANVEQYDKKSLSELIAGLFDADGSVYYNKKKKTTRVSLTNISLELLKDTQAHLLKFGIHSSIYKEKKARMTEWGYMSKDAYVLYVSKDNDVKQFIENIPLIHSIKKQRLSEFVPGNRDFCNGNDTFRLTGAKDEVFLEDRAVISGFKFETIKEVEFIGEQYVYNLSALENHTYVANGFITHNTSGDMENYHDAKELFLNPSSLNFLEFDDPDNKERKVGLFLGNKYRYEAKRETTFGDYLGIEDKKSDLYNIPFLEADEEKADKILEDTLELRLKDPDKTGYYKEVMYYPKDIDSMFLTNANNMYNSKSCQAQQNRITEMGITGTPVELFHDGTQIQWKHSKKDYITEWPIQKQSKDAPIMIYEFPVPDAPKFLYCFGLDPYTQDSSNSSDSLGALYIYKRLHSVTGEGFQNTFVASYVARTETQEEFEENCRLLIMYYNAFGLVENDQPSFIKYMISKNCAEQYLAPEPRDLISSLVKNSNTSRRFGISRQPKAIREHLNNVLKRYMEEVIHTESDPESGVVLRETRGITRILDNTLLEELKGFSPTANCDRQVAASLAILMAQELDPLLGTAIGENSSKKARTISQAIDGASRKTFRGGGNPFSNKLKRSLFKR